MPTGPRGINWQNSADATPDTILKALGAFVRTLRSGDSPWDKYEKGDKKAVGEEAVRLYEGFGKAEKKSERRRHQAEA